MSRRPCDPSLSRRAFVAASAAGATLGSAAVASRSTGTDGDDPLPTRSVLAREDLVDGDAYVRWRVDPVEAPLSRHLASKMSGFDPAAGLVTGFVATASADGPAVVESAIFPDAEGLDDAIDEWVAEAHAGTTTRTTPDEHAVEWVSTGEHEREVLRLDRLPEAYVAITTASGARGAALDPRAAANYYAGLVRSRASERLQAGAEL